MSTTRRNGFTLIEMLVVIAIIGILASLILGAVMMVRAKIPAATTRNDISQLGIGLSKFHAKYKFYPPSQVKLYSRLASYGNPPTAGLNAQSVAVISKMFPNIAWATTPIKWDGVNTNVDVKLEGDQCLVFFLGGLPGQPPQGFSNNPADPSAATADRIKFFDFDAKRIIIRPGLTGQAAAFPSFQDGYGKQPYAYFSSMSSSFRENGYDTTGIPAPLGVSPYKVNATKYHNPSTFQIISAGNDGVFGPGGLWPAMPIPAGVADDLANFNGDTVLGSPQ